MVSRGRIIESFIVGLRAIGWPWWLCALTLILSCAYLLSGPIWDVDFWWHLASGRAIVADGALPESDLFTVMVDPIDADRFSLLKAYWLAQIIFYKVFATFGFSGLVVLRISLLLLIPFLLLFHAAWYRLPAAVALFGVALCAWMTTYLTGDRPHLFSFCLMVPLLMLLETVGYAQRAGFAGYRLRGIWAIGLLLALWSNLHPGFLAGIALLGAYLCGELGKALLLRYPVSWQALCKLMGSIGLAMTCSLANPNGISTYLGMYRFEGGVLQAKTPEYLSLFTVYRVYGQILYPFLLALAAFVVFLLLARRRVDLTRVLLLVCLAGFGMSTLRYAPFFVLGLAVLLVRECSLLEFPGKRAFVAGCGVAAVGVVLTLLVLCVQKTDSVFAGGSVEPFDHGRFPQVAASFFKERELVGPVFNHYDWGGFLGWQFASRHKVFIDTRNLNVGKFSEYTHALWTPGAWRKVFARYGIVAVVMPRINRASGELYHLTTELAEADDWALVFIDECAMVLVPRGGVGPVPGEVAKSLIYRHVVNDARQALNTGRPARNGLLALAWAYSKLGMLAEAREASEAARRL